MAEAMSPRGPDGAGVWSQGRVALGHRRLKIIDLTEAGCPAHGRLGAGAVHRLERLHLQLQAAASRAERARLPLLLHQRHRGPAQGLPPLGRPVRRPPARHVRVRDRRTRQRPSAARPRSAGHQAAVPHRGRLTHPVRVLASCTARRWRRRHPHRPRRAAPLPVVPLRRPAAAHDPARGRQGAARVTLVAIEPDGRKTTTTVLGTRLHAARGPGRLVRTRLGGRRSRVAARRGRAPAGRRRTGRMPAVRRRRLQPHRRAARRSGPTRPADLLDRLRIGRRRQRRRVQVLRHHRQAFRHRPPPDPDQHRPHAARARRRDRCHERADGQPRLRRLLSAQPGSGQARQGGAVRPGRRRGVRRLPLVSADGRRDLAGRRGGQLSQRVLRPRHRRHRRARHARLSRRRAMPAGSSSPSASPAPAPRPVSTAPCGSTPPSCWSTIRSSASTT